MSEASRTSDQAICEDSTNATSSQGLELGHTPLETLDGQMILPVGLEAAPARVSVQAGSGEASQISVTYGLHGSGSLASAALTQSLANKLRQKTASLGSTLFRLTWKERITPSGRRICALRAWALLTSDNDYTSWPTPLDDDANNGTRDSGSFTSLTRTARLATWATPRVGGAADTARRENRTGRRHQGDDLETQALLTASGETPNGSTAKTENIGQLNPELACWLQGLPPEWDAFMVTETAYVRQSRRRS